MNQLFLLAALLCGQASLAPLPSPRPAPSPAPREWLAIAVPGPQGDFKVWGWKDAGQVRYFEQEQAPARAQIKTDTGLNYGLDLGWFKSQVPGVFETNDPNFDGSKFVGDRHADPPDPPLPSSTSFEVHPFAVVAFLGVAFLIQYGRLKRRA